MFEIKTVSGLEFEPEGHIYKLDGRRLPSVTQLMRPMSMMVYGGVDESALNAAADRGTRVHEQVSNYVQYGILETDEDTEPYVGAFLKFCEEHNPVWLASEHMVAHMTMGYVGTVDLIGLVGDAKGDGVDVVDLKCTAAFHPVLLAAQVSAYAEAMRSMGMRVRNTYGLQLLSSGAYRFERLEDGYKTFLHSMAITLEMMKEAN